MPIMLGTMGVLPFVGAQGPSSRVWGITIKIYIFGFKIVNFFSNKSNKCQDDSAKVIVVYCPSKSL